MEMQLHIFTLCSPKKDLFFTEKYKSSIVLSNEVSVIGSKHTK